MAKIVDKLDNINTTLEKMLKVIEKPKHPFLITLETAGMIIGILGIIALIDTVLKWFKEGLW